MFVTAAAALVPWLLALAKVKTTLSATTTHNGCSSHVGAEVEDVVSCTSGNDSVSNTATSQVDGVITRATDESGSLDVGRCTNQRAGCACNVKPRGVDLSTSDDGVGTAPVTVTLTAVSVKVMESLPAPAVSSPPLTAALKMKVSLDEPEVIVVPSLSQQRRC